MEPGSISAQRGTLEDPEVLQNVPGHLIPILEREFDDFKTEAGKFLAGDMPEDEFIKFRLKQGVYGQRQPDVQMIRVKLPFGGITPEQLESFADVIEKYVPLNKGHVTTRQNIQLHHIPLPEVEQAIRELSESGLSSREGCGNTVRNVTGDPWAGVAADELFDMTPYVGAYVRYFVRHPTTQAMPRKIKTAFDGSEQGRAISEIHDIAYRARVQQIEGRGEVKGAQMLVGGGTSIMPRLAPALYEFVELDNGDYLKIAEAVFRIFDRQDWLRVNRARARIKVFVDKFGIDELRRQVEEELQGDWVNERDFSVEHRLFVDDERESAPAPRAGYTSPNGDSSEFERFRTANVAAQKQEGFVTVEVKITRGDLNPEQLRGLAQIVRDYAGAAEPAAALGAPRERVRGVARAGRAGPGGRGHTRDHGRGLVPGHRFLQAGDHELDGPERGGAGAGAVDGHNRPAYP
jgi:sulfite reductase beta subunit-like hemoprotein